MSTLTITVIAVDRWRSVANTNPGSVQLSYASVFAVIAAVWAISFTGGPTALVRKGN